MSAFSNYAEQQVINALLRGQTYTGGSVYMALFTSDPTDAGSGTELADSGYSRQAVTFQAPHATAGSTKNATEVSFPAIVDTEVTITHWAIFDAQSSGNMLFHGSLTNPKTLDVSDILTFPAESLTITLA